jgi:tripartite-type tricarboxylate transporter receptor subunit TctC
VRFRHAVLAFAGAATVYSPVHAQDASTYPTKPVRVIVAVAAGGGVDIQARLFSQKLGEALKRSFVVENRPSAGGADAFGLVATASPDGYTLLAVNPSFTLPVSFAKNLPDPVRDYTPVSLLTRAPFMMVVHPSIPVKSPKEFIALARSQPGKLTLCGAPTGSATHLAAAWFFKLANIDITYVPYRGTGPAQSALIGGETAATMASVVSVGTHISSGRLRALGVTTSQRSKLYPNLPTVAEHGAPGFDYATFFGFVSAANTPAPIIAKLNGELLKILAMPDIQERFREDGAEAIGSTPEQFRQFIGGEAARWRKVVQETGIRPE